MSGTVSGGKKAAATNMKNDPNFYRRIGSMGGSVVTDKPKGFAANPKLAEEAGRKGGLTSKRGKSEACVERIKVAKQMRRDGATLREIAETLNVTQGTISKYLISD